MTRVFTSTAREQPKPSWRPPKAVIEAYGTSVDFVLAEEPADLPRRVGSFFGPDERREFTNIWGSIASAGASGKGQGDSLASRGVFACRRASFGTRLHGASVGTTFGYPPPDSEDAKGRA